MNASRPSILAPAIKFTVFTLIVAIATAMLAFTIANSNFDEKRSYHARFTDVAGLLKGSDVRIAGVKVGTVEDVEVVDRNLADVEFTVEKDIAVPESANALVRYRNLIGQRYLAIEPGVGETGKTLESGATIPLARTTPALNLTTLFNGFKPLFAALDPEEINKLSYELIQVLQGEGGTIESLLSSTASLTSQVADRDAVIGRVITNLNAVLDTVNARDDQLSGLVSSLQQLVSGLAADRAPIGQAVSALSELTDVTAGLVGEVRPALKADVAGLGALADNLVRNQDTIDRTLKGLPDKLTTLIRTASYGAWFNFYLCGLGGNISLPPFVGETTVPAYVNTNGRCSA